MRKIKTIVVLGGTGFVGRELLTQLSAAGYQCRVPTRSLKQHSDLDTPNVTLVQANVHKLAELRDVLNGCDAVINLVGVLHDSKKSGMSFASAHVELTQNIINICTELGIARYLHMSSINADLAAPSQYLRSKGRAQDNVLASQLNFTIFQPSVIFGPGDSFINRFAQLLKIPNPLFFLPKPEARFAPVAVSDVARAFVDSLENETTFGQTYTCCGPSEYTMRELIELIAKTLGRRRKIIGLNDSLSQLTASILGVMPGKPFTKDNFLSMQVDSVCKNNGLLKLGIHPVSLEQKIDKVLGL